MADPPTDEQHHEGDRGEPQRRTAPQRFWQTQFASNRPPGRSGSAGAFVVLWTLLAMAAIAGVAIGDPGWALGFVVLGFGLVVATITSMVRDEFVPWVAPLNLLALAVMVAGAAIGWTQ